MCFLKQMFSYFSKERIKAVTLSTNYCSAKNSFAVELSEQMGFSLCWDGGAGHWVSLRKLLHK